MSPSALVMAKAPRPGAVKTRLEPVLGPHGCAALQVALIDVAARWALAVAEPGAAYLAHAGDERLLPRLPQGVARFADGSGDLGDRLMHATDRVFSRHGGPLLVVGTDMPLLTRAHAREASDALAEADVCFGPASDGGYWLVGLVRPCPSLFALGDAWGGPEVLERSLALAEEAGLRVGLLREERDLDDADDAEALQADPRLPAEIAALLR